ncbi:carboxypeptidase-like regulatory domain-containing protein [Aquimarina sp. W85]|uniref:carboxypeptidase-like regulatory domain-containing protein n=1 Tax=Aquimarina rhodophyticola TaxID=3342246 RepID=UPI00366AC6ED
MKELLIISLVFSFSICSLYSQNKTIKGRVISEDFETLPGVSIMIKDTVKVGRTDIKGFFQVDIPLSEERIQFSFLGLESTTIELKEKCNKVDVVMMYSYTYDFITLKRADKKRKKRHKKLPKIHKQAFEKGIFETKCACYNRTFESFYLQEN